MAIETYELRRRDDGSHRVLPSGHKNFRFPGGEAHIDFDPPTASTQIAYLTGGDANDLLGLAMWADACRRNGRVRTIAVIPYLPGARQDRASTKTSKVGAPLGVKVYADIINSMGIDRIVCLDPHSAVMPALLDRLTVVNLDQLDVWDRFEVAGVIAPDLGARTRAESVGDVLGVKTYQAFKHRDPATGKLSKFSCEPLPAEGTFLVVDDICDGGGTFMGLAEVTGLPPERLALWVTHGVFSGDPLLLSKYFGLIACTDSHPGHGNPCGERMVFPMLRTLVDAALEDMLPR